MENLWRLIKKLISICISAIAFVFFIGMFNDLGLLFGVAVAAALWEFCE